MVPLDAQPRHALLLTQLHELAAHRVTAEADVQEEFRQRLCSAVRVVLLVVRENDLRSRVHLHVRANTHVGDARIC